MSQTSSAVTSSRRSQRKKKLTLKAKDYLTVKELIGQDSSTSDLFPDSLSCGSYNQTTASSEEQDSDEVNDSGEEGEQIISPSGIINMKPKLSSNKVTSKIKSNFTVKNILDSQTRNMCQISSSLTPSRRSERKKKLTLKAKDYLTVKELIGEDSSTSDIYSDSSSCGNYNQATTSSSEEQGSDEVDDLGTEDEQIISPGDIINMKPKFLSSNKVASKRTVNNNKKSKTSQSYMIKADYYFHNNSEKKSHTSNHTLDKLKKPRLSQDELQKLLSKMTVTGNHSKYIKETYKQNKTYFEKWLCLLHEGFNVLVYGLGSKNKILHDFHEECLSNMPVIVVNGFFPSLTLKEIIDAIMIEILECSDVPSNIFEATEVIAKEFGRYPNLHLYLIVHNIESDTLRSSLKHQSILANLATVNNIHLIASIDHINAPLIWDQNKLSKFNFTWWDITTFLPYKDETSFETSMMIAKTGSLALSSLRNIFLSLTSNSKGIYLIIAKHQVQNANQFYQGMLFKDLYWASREAFLVSSDLALRAQLTEFVDHKILRFRRTADGAEHLIIPIPNNLLQQFLNDQ